MLGLRVRQLLGEGVGEVLLLLGLGLLGQVQGQQLRDIERTRAQTEGR